MRLTPEEIGDNLDLEVEGRTDNNSVWMYQEH